MSHHRASIEPSITTKLRVVFNGTAKTTNNKSFMDVLEIGPTVQNDLISIILKFRKYPYAITVVSFLSPVIIKAKIIMQNLWNVQKEWDKRVSEYVEIFWKQHV